MSAYGFHGDAGPSARPAMPSFDGPASMPVRCSAAGATHPGQLRPHNEDRWHVDPASGIYVVADGMGGYNAGEVASSLAVQAIVETIAAASADRADDASSMRDDAREAGGRALDAIAWLAMQRALARANAAILAAAARRPECLGMGTTAVCAHVNEGLATIGHVGDSRAYLMRGGSLERLTRDHSVKQALADAGLDRDPHSPTMRGVLTRALGVEPSVDADILQCRLLPGDKLLLCSDGLTDMVADAGIESLLCAATDAQDVATRLVERALVAGGHDNVTVLLVLVQRA